MDLQTPGPEQTPSGHVVDSQTSGPSSAGAQRTFRWQDIQFSPTPQQRLTSAADEDREIAVSAAAETIQPTRAEQRQTQSEEQWEPGGGENWAQFLFGDESEIDLNEYQEVTMENVQQPVEGESVDVLGKFVQKGKQIPGQHKGSA